MDGFTAITEIEQWVIDRVRERRMKIGISQAALSQLLNKADGFVGLVENPKRREKYNLNHINALAEALQCSPKDFLPAEPLKTPR